MTNILKTMNNAYLVKLKSGVVDYISNKVDSICNSIDSALDDLVERHLDDLSMVEYTRYPDSKTVRIRYTVQHTKSCTIPNGDPNQLVMTETESTEFRIMDPNDDTAHVSTDRITDIVSSNSCSIM